jgi:hypothetical protein
MKTPAASHDPIVFDPDFEDDDTTSKIIDFNAYRLGSVRRVLSHEVIRADDIEDVDELDMLLLAVSGMGYR